MRMRVRTLIAGFGLVIGSGNLSAQLPQIPPIPGNSGPSSGSSLPVIPIAPQSTGQPIVPTGTQSPNPLPLPPASGRPGAYSPSSPIVPQNPIMQPGVYGQNSPSFPQNPAAYMPGGNPPSTQPLIPNGSNYGSSQAYPNPIAQPLEITLPRPENKIGINVGDVTLKHMQGGWQLWAGPRLLRDFGDHEMDARDALRVYRDLRPTEWTTIGAGKPIVEYGLVYGRTPLTVATPTADDQHGSFPVAPIGDGRPPATGAGAKQIIPIDLRTVRIEAIRGVWCLRDDYNIHLNFGVNKLDAEQALGAVRKYGFNRVGIVGNPAPAMTYFFAAPDAGQVMSKNAIAQAGLQAQIENLRKVGIPVGGLGYVGEMVRFNPREIDIKKEGSEWLVTAGTEVLGHFGPTEWIARDAARMIQDARFTEFCKVGSAGLTFFLANGRAPSRVPFNVQERQFDPNSLSVRKNNDHFAVTENGRFLFDCANAEEGEILIRVLQFYQFDQLCHLGPSPKLGISFLAKSR